MIYKQMIPMEQTTGWQLKYAHKVANSFMVTQTDFRWFKILQMSKLVIRILKL